MKPIYRAWDKKYKVMLERFAIYSEGDHIGMSYDDAREYYTEEQLEESEGTHFSSGDDWIFILNYFELMVCIPRKDKNGVQIYQGDIVQPGLGEIIFDEIRAMFLVKWHEKTFKLIRASNPDYHNGEPLFGNSEVAWEVIGSIYVNPELID